VRGFHAADPARASAAAVTGQGGAEHNRHIVRGYGALVDHLARPLLDAGLVTTSAPVVSVRWRRGAVEIAARSRAGLTLPPLRARAALVTVPLAVLRAGEPRFTPALPVEKRRAIAALATGGVVKAHLRFRRRLWREPFGFVHLPGGPFHAWWTREDEPVLVGWAGGPNADRLARTGVDQALLLAGRTARRVLGVAERDFAAAFVDGTIDDWSGDPWARGAYSWVPVGARWAQPALGLPIAGTLFFAGEATDAAGMNGTTAGALASADRAVGEILAALRARGR